MTDVTDPRTALEALAEKWSYWSRIAGESGDLIASDSFRVAARDLREVIVSLAPAASGATQVPDTASVGTVASPEVLCGFPSSVSDATCTLPVGHPAHEPWRFHRFTQANPVASPEADDTTDLDDPLPMPPAKTWEMGPPVASPEAVGGEHVVIAVMADHADCERAYANAIANPSFESVVMHGPEAHEPTPPPPAPESTEALRRLVERTAAMGFCSQTHHEHLMRDAQAALIDQPAARAEPLDVETMAKALHAPCLTPERPATSRGGWHGVEYHVSDAERLAAAYAEARRG